MKLFQPFTFLFLIFPIFVIGIGNSNHCHAQWRVLHQPGQNVTRWLGQGFSAGYHHRNPGHRTDYYQPYGYSNSYRLSGHSQQSNLIQKFSSPSVSNSFVHPPLPLINGWDALSEIDDNPNSRIIPAENATPGSQPIIDQAPVRGNRLPIPPRRQSPFDFDW